MLRLLGDGREIFIFIFIFISLVDGFKKKRGGGGLMVVRGGLIV